MPEESVRVPLLPPAASNIRKPTRTLVTTGPFALSRNPEYVAFTAMYPGIAFIFLLPVLLFIRNGVGSDASRPLSYLV